MLARNESERQCIQRLSVYVFTLNAYTVYIELLSASSHPFPRLPFLVCGNGLNGITVAHMRETTHKVLDIRTQILFR